MTSGVKCVTKPYQLRPFFYYLNLVNNLTPQTINLLNICSRL
ncbi:Uncharacterised protein [Yersinia bercovieri]|nr:Uncharacterised protein [Yersinia bercovieri]CNE75218.1 Uncharacterised protein [Yersinia bercovieri]CNI29064.1 Uncharacterised protein [Yersinia bercovieri]